MARVEREECGMKFIRFFRAEQRQGVWRFRDLDLPGVKRGEIARDEDDLKQKLAGGMATVIVPAKPLWVRLFRSLWPLRGINVPADGVVREVMLG